MGQPSTARRGGRENGGGRKKELVQFLLRIYNGPHVANFTAKFRLQCMKCLLFPLCRPLRITYEEPSHLLYLFLASFAFPQHTSYEENIMLEKYGHLLEHLHTSKFTSNKWS